MKQNMVRALAALCALLLLCSPLCGFAEETTGAIASVRDLDGKAIGVMTGSTMDQYTDLFIQNAQKEYYNAFSDIMRMTVFPARTQKSARSSTA